MSAAGGGAPRLTLRGSALVRDSGIADVISSAQQLPIEQLPDT